MAKAPPKTILIADVPQLEDVLRACFANHLVDYTTEFEEAVRLLRAGSYDMVLIGLHFAESRMFSLLRFVRQQRHLDETPVVCVVGMPTLLSREVRKGIRDAVHVVGGDAFIDFSLQEKDLTELRENLQGLFRHREAGGAAESASDRSHEIVERQGDGAPKL